jgi:maltose alpha-D-glucosyltransferase/alpha-amylase
VSKAEQSNTSILYGDAFILKLYRRLEPGVNPDLEMGAYLTARGFPHTPQLAGAIEYRTPRSTMTAAVLQQFVPNQGDAWAYALGEARAFAGRSEGVRDPGNFWLLLDQQPGPDVRARIGAFLESAALLGTRTAEMHLALAQPTEDSDFAPEPLTPAYRRVLADRIAGQAHNAFALLRSRMGELPAAVSEHAADALPFENDVAARCRAVGERNIEASVSRHHGDYHLGQVLWTGSDFVIIDFEGEPLRPLRERRMKRSPLRDVAGMLRSFDYAARAVMQSHVEAAATWTSWVSAAFLKAYLSSAGAAVFVPRTRGQIETLLTAYLLEKATYEIIYELNNRPAWTGIPIRGMLQLIR